MALFLILCCFILCCFTFRCLGLSFVQVGSGDSLLGDTLRSTVAAVCVNALLDSSCSKDFAVVNTDGPAPSEAELSQRIAALA